MELIYNNSYGAIYRLAQSPLPDCELQVVVDSVGLFMSRDDLENLLDIVQKSYGPCGCEQCGNNPCNRIWCTNALIDIGLKVNDNVLDHLQDLITGARFMLNMDNLLEANQVNAQNQNWQNGKGTGH